MSKRTVHQQGIEQFVKAYLKRLGNGANKAPERKYILKSIALIQDVFGFPCCSGGTTVSFVTPKHNQLTTAIAAIVNKFRIIRRLYRLSLERILDMLFFALYGCCCTNVTLTFGTGTTSSNAQIQISDAITGQLLAQTTLGGPSGQTFCIPDKYFESSPVNFCLNIIDSANGICGRGGGEYFLGLNSDPIGTAIINPTGGTTGEVCTGFVPNQYLTTNGYTLEIECGVG